ncbi:hypothetical protein P152DRAFT_425554 [Eremomyces bilateralis CBS 781.70]|uniref:Uncharacterized protein n=1 Tax=Eremomyces bilateralis CBS 781.70 TaxID=1392243 RepID=A0A6G1FQQ4_9PEZI|nr:uncharacterized protein P152DRAFT_425554 [Eremomyces bilateralis CBS 781.70]KAF1808040.1 hypothetical protein P152DRAFT_425554 [Eremomyces bilateralis CBS 781.70]
MKSQAFSENTRGYGRDPTLWYDRITFCAEFFNLKTLGEITAVNSGKTLPEKKDLMNWDNHARVFFHEITHLNYFMNANASSPYVRDLQSNVIWNGRRSWESMYGPLFAKVLANYVEPPPYNTAQWSGYYPQRNADNFAWFAMAKYVQKQILVYPDRPNVRRMAPLQEPRDVDGGPPLLETEPAQPDDTVSDPPYDSGNDIFRPGCPDVGGVARDISAAAIGAEFEALVAQIDAVPGVIEGPLPQPGNETGPNPSTPGGSGGDAGQQVALASYIHPGGGYDLWRRMIAYPNDKVSVLVANVLNGPDVAVNKKWMAVLTEAVAKKKKVIGYVRTGYLGLATSDDPKFEPFETRLGSRTVEDWVAQIERDVDLWYKLYGADKIGGIFFDEGWNQCGDTSNPNRWAEVYQFISDNTKRKYPGAYTVLNPGTGVEKCYENSSDTLMTFESSYENYIMKNYTEINWKPSDPRKIWHIIYQVPEDRAVEVAKLAAENKAGLIHITPAVMPNPYNSLPSETYMDKIINFVPGGSPLIQDHLSSYNGGSSPGKPVTKVTGLDYTSLHVEWSHPGGNPYGFAVYTGEEELVRLPGFMRKVTIGNILIETKAMVVTVKAIGADGKMGDASNPHGGATKGLDGRVVRDVKIKTSPTETTIEANVLLPYGFIRIYFTDDSRYHNWGAWPISYGPNFVTAHYMVEGSTLFKYDGPATADANDNREFKWKEVGERNNVKITRDKTHFKWVIPMGTSNEGVDPTYAVIQTEGYNRFTNVFLPCPSDMSEKKGTDNAYCIGQRAYDCQGAPLCGHALNTVKNCDLAASFLLNEPDTIYEANQALPKSGMCSLDSLIGQGCKVYVQGKDETGKSCTISGKDMWQAYQDIMRFSTCKSCGTKHFGNGCMVSRDYHFNVAGQGCGKPAMSTVSRFLNETEALDEALSLNQTTPSNETTTNEKIGRRWQG